MTIKSSKVEFVFLRGSINVFMNDLRKFREIMKNFSKDEVLEIAHNLEAVKEIINDIEKEALKRI